jgi:nucleoside-diphosphate-sugar epimerase
MTKWLAERLVATFCTREAIPFRIFRLANVFGKGDNYSRRKNALQYLINELRHNRPIELYYGGDFIRDYIHVDDVCEALYKGMDVLPLNDVYNIGSGIPLKFKDLIGIAKEVLGSTSEIMSIEPPYFHKEVSTKDFYMDTTKVKNYGICTNLSPYEKLVRTILDEN